MKRYKTPRLLVADAYTIGSSNRFESQEAQEYSCYYLTFRRGPAYQFKKRGYETPYSNDTDNRIVFYGLSRIIDELLSEPITHEEIDDTVAFLKHRKYATTGLKDFGFDEWMWRQLGMYDG